MPSKSEVGRDHVGARGIIALALLMLLLMPVLVYALLQFWPPAITNTQGGSGEPANNIRLFLWAFPIDREVSLFMIVLIAGAIGGAIHSIRSLYWYVGNRSLRYSWILMYCSLPLTGAALALIAYLVVRGGLTTSLSSSEDVNPFGITAAAALVGLFSRETAEKLRSVFETLLAPAEKGKDPATMGTISGLEPLKGPAGTLVTILGRGFADAIEVTFGDQQATRLTIFTDTRMTALVPSGATGPVPVRVVKPAGALEAPNDFNITSAP
ncbi:IPT/TIG domain-containing protein [Pseudarthrobacter sulfonivorans]|uniref:IPT/TIG domain-containing protein n=2 Tax=Pseudarthrobacter sulfonivorans TaxID=121292 RepID=UPI00389A456E